MKTLKLRGSPLELLSVTDLSAGSGSRFYEVEITLP